MKCLPRNVVHLEWSEPKFKALKAETKKAIEVGLPKPSETHIAPLCAPDARYRAIRLKDHPGEFHSCFDLILFFPISLPFWNGNICSVPLYLQLMQLVLIFEDI